MGGSKAATPGIPARFRGSDWLWTGLICVIALVAVVGTDSQLGFTYDEPIYGGVGRRNVEWYGVVWDALWSGQLVSACSHEVIDRYWQSKDMQPPVPKILAGISVELLAGMLGYLPAIRFGTAFLFALLIWTICWFGVETHNRLVGYFAALALLMMPRFFGHAHLTALDVPIAALVFATAAAYWKCVTAKTWRWTVITGICFGFALGCKMNAVLLVPALALLMLHRDRGGWLRFVAAFAAVGPLVFFLLWPWLWHDSFQHLLEYARFHFRHYPIGVTYFGKNYVYAPWHYPYVMLAITTPLPILLLCLTGVGDRLMSWGRRRETPFPVADELIVLASAFQVIAFALPSTPKYNGVRLFLGVLPFVALFSGIGADRFLSWLVHQPWTDKLAAQIPALPTKLTVLVAGLLLVPGLQGILATYPNELSYYNVLIGGVRGAVAHGFEATYWGETYYQTLSFINSRAPRDGRVFVWPPGVVSYMKMYQDSGLLRDDLSLVSGKQAFRSADVVVFHNRPGELSGMPILLDWLHRVPPTYAVTLDGVPLCLVYLRQPGR